MQIFHTNFDKRASRKNIYVKLVSSIVVLAGQVNQPARVTTNPRHRVGSAQLSSSLIGWADHVTLFWRTGRLHGRELDMDFLLQR